MICSFGTHEILYNIRTIIYLQVFSDITYEKLSRYNFARRYFIWLTRPHIISNWCIFYYIINSPWQIFQATIINCLQKLLNFWNTADYKSTFDNDLVTFYFRQNICNLYSALIINTWVFMWEMAFSMVSLIEIATSINIIGRK